MLIYKSDEIIGRHLHQMHLPFIPIFQTDSIDKLISIESCKQTVATLYQLIKKLIIFIVTFHHNQIYLEQAVALWPQFHNSHLQYN